MQLLHIGPFPYLKIFTEPVTSYISFYSIPSTVTLDAHSSVEWAGMCLFWLKKWGSRDYSPIEEHPSYFPHYVWHAWFAHFCIGGIEVLGAVWHEFQFWFYHFLVTRPWAIYVAFVSSVSLSINCSPPLSTVRMIKLDNSCKAIGLELGMQQIWIYLLFLSCFK